LSAPSLRYLSLAEVLELHRRITALSGGAVSLRDLGALESAVAQPRASFAGEDLYPDLATKATALAFSLINNHPFVDGNKRVGHAALETFLMLNGYELDATVDAGEQIILAVAAGQVVREELLEWVRAHLKTIGP
jgi:death on curing protein